MASNAQTLHLILVCIVCSVTVSFMHSQLCYLNLLRLPVLPCYQNNMVNTRSLLCYPNNMVKILITINTLCILLPAVNYVTLQIPDNMLRIYSYYSCLLPCVTCHYPHTHNKYIFIPVLLEKLHLSGLLPWQ